MNAENVSAMADAVLVARLKELVGEEQRLCAVMLAHLGEVNARQLYLPAACSSMHAYCVKVLGMAEEVAFKRIRAARAARRFTAVFEAVADGRLNVSSVVLLAPHLTEANVTLLVAEASGRSKAEIEVVLARWAPKPDVPPRLDPVGEQTTLEVDPGPPVDPGPVARARRSVRPLAPERFALQVTVDGETKEMLMRAQALMRHQVPDGDLALVIKSALAALLDRIESRKLGKAKNPRPASKSGGRYVPRAVRRAVVERDGERCSFVSGDGRRCDEKGFLELDHVVPVARGGESTVDGVRVLCRGHNQYEAKRVMGRDVVEAAKRANAMEHDVLVGLRRMGVTTSDARRAVADSRGKGATIEERIRAALLVLNAIYRERRAGTGCDEVRMFE
jgi:hypothetical protein